MSPLLTVMLALFAVLCYFVVICQRELAAKRGAQPSRALAATGAPATDKAEELSRHLHALAASADGREGESDSWAASLAAELDAASDKTAAVFAAAVRLAEDNRRLHEELNAARLGERATPDAGLREELRRRLAELRRCATPFSLVRIDIRHLEKVADQHGAAASEELVRQVEAFLVKTVRGMDVVARCGSWGLAVVLPGIILSNAEKAAQRIVEAAAKTTFSIAGSEIGATLSVGAAEAAAGESPQDVIRRANAALLAAQDADRRSAPSASDSSAEPGAGAARQKRRYHAEGVQRIAPYEEGKLPDPAAFRDVMCQDISTTGFAFLAPERPPYDRLVVELGSGKKRKLMTAIVKNCVAAGAESDHLFRVECVFTGRIDPLSGAGSVPLEQVVDLDRSGQVDQGLPLVSNGLDVAGNR